MAAQFQLVMHQGPTPGKVFPLEGEVITIGREAGNNIVINDPEVSRKHTQFVSQGGKIIITDLGSTNGTFVDGQRLTGQHILQPGQVISLGEQISLIFEAVVTVDPNATMVSTSHPALAGGIPSASVPAAEPISSQPAPTPVYAGQVPSGPSAPYSAPAPKKSGGGSKIAIIVVIFMLLCLICLCGGVIWYIDSNNLWCQFLPFLFGSSCG